LEDVYNTRRYILFIPTEGHLTDQIKGKLNHKECLLIICSKAFAFEPDCKLRELDQTEKCLHEFDNPKSATSKVNAARVMGGKHSTRFYRHENERRQIKKAWERNVSKYPPSNLKYADHVLEYAKHVMTMVTAIPDLSADERNFITALSPNYLSRYAKREKWKLPSRGKSLKSSPTK
jgi:hypothetical protein